MSPKLPQNLTLTKHFAAAREALSKTHFDELWRKFLELYARFKLLPRREAYRRVVEITEECSRSILKDPTVSCKQGCAFCCYQLVSVTPDEVERLAPLVKQERLDLLKKQVCLTEDEYSYNPDSRCVFLSDAGQCEVYEDRPLSCRITFGREPEKCGTEEDQVVPVGWMAEAAVTALWTIEGAEDMPAALIRRLHDSSTK